MSGREDRTHIQGQFSKTMLPSFDSPVHPLALYNYSFKLSIITKSSEAHARVLSWPLWNNHSSLSEHQCSYLPRMRRKIRRMRGWSPHAVSLWE
jgi:hypothetical protein